jgi:hypothetical protein
MKEDTNNSNKILNSRKTLTMTRGRMQGTETITIKMKTEIET